MIMFDSNILIDHDKMKTNVQLLLQSSLGRSEMFGWFPTLLAWFFYPGCPRPGEDV